MNKRTTYSEDDNIIINVGNLMNGTDWKYEVGYCILQFLPFNWSHYGNLNIKTCSLKQDTYSSPYRCVNIDYAISYITSVLDDMLGNITHSGFIDKKLVLTWENDNNTHSKNIEIYFKV